MGKIFYIMGKSATGKDSIYKKLIRQKELKLSELLIYTTRPKRPGETDGKEYYFSDEEHLKKLRKENRVIEERVYHTVYGDWYYFTADEGQIDLKEKNYLGIGTPESYVRMKEYFGKGKMVPLYIECDDGLRLKRAIKREEKQKKPEYRELVRRYLADEEDFSREALKAAGIRKKFSNNGRISDCVKEISEYIKGRK